MDYTANDIIQAVEKKYPLSGEHKVKNISDLDLDLKQETHFQFIIGVTKADLMGSVNFDTYQYRVKERLERLPIEFNCLGWPFKGYEQEEAITVLSELGEYYNAELDINKMIGRLNIKPKDEYEYYYIVVTIVSLPVFIAG